MKRSGSEANELRRRDVLKILTTAAGASLCPLPLRLAIAQTSTAAVPLATPIRGLVRRAGRLLQPIQIQLPDVSAGATIVTKLNGAEVDRRTLSTAENSFDVFTDPVNSAQDLQVAVLVNGRSEALAVRLLPVYHTLIYILPHSHHDLGYTDIQPKIEEKQMQNITLGIELARKTADYPEGSRFVWNLEVLWGADMYMQRRSQPEKEALIEAVRRGWVALNGLYANELTGLCRPEELLQLFRYSKVLGKQCGVAVDSAMLSDVPGYTWGTVTAMAKQGIRYFSAAPNNSDRIGTIRSTWHDKPFWHLSPSGREKVLVWMPGHGYSSWAAGNADMAAGCQDYLDSVNFPYSISYIRWSGHGDNAVPDPQICEFVKSWNEEYEWPKFAIASTSEAFAEFEKRHGNEIPQFKGDLTPYWEDGAGSSALETRINRNSADRLVQAEAMAAILSVAYPAAKFNDAWRNVLLYSEHTWGASGSVRNPDAPMTKAQWTCKRQFALDGESQSKSLLAALTPSQQSPTDGVDVDVLNTTSWPRTEVVYLSREMSAIGDQVRTAAGALVPSQRLSNGELAFLASAVQAFGSAYFRVTAGQPHVPSMPASVREGLLDNGIVRARVDATTGNLVEFVRHEGRRNLIDTAGTEDANEFLFVKGRDFADLWKLQRENAALRAQDDAVDGPDIGSIEKSAPAHIRVEESGPLVASLIAESSAPGCNSLTRRVRLVAGADWLELSNTVDKKPSPRNPFSENPSTSGAWSQYGGKESVHFAFPFAIPDGQIHMDIPFAEMRPEIDQLPGANKNWLPVGRWIDVANESTGITWVTLDAPLVEIGAVSATLVGSNHNGLLWRDHITPTQKLYSWAMNNHWETNYRASQQGPVEFRYALRAHQGYDPAAASKFAIGLSQPLLTANAREGTSATVLPEIEPSDVLALTVKPADEGDAFIVRLFGASGEDRQATLRWKERRRRRVWKSDLSEQPLEPIDGSIPVAGWDLVTLRIEHHSG